MRYGCIERRVASVYLLVRSKVVKLMVIYLSLTSDRSTCEHVHDPLSCDYMIVQGLILTGMDLLAPLTQNPKWHLSSTCSYVNQEEVRHDHVCTLRNLSPILVNLCEVRYAEVATHANQNVTIQKCGFCHLWIFWEGSRLDHSSYGIFSEYLLVLLVVSKCGAQWSTRSQLPQSQM